MAKNGKLTEGHCKALLAITDPEKQYTTAIQMLERGQTVRQVEKKAKIKETKEEQKRNHILYKSIEDNFQSFFGTKVKEVRDGLVESTYTPKSFLSVETTIF